jgi:DNA-directed RNA polymerase beta' subunit
VFENFHCIYAATFDGDEMNMHMAQNVMAETELRHLAAIPYQIISPAANSPIIGIYQDSLLGSYRMTRKNVTFSPSKAMDLLMMYPHVNTKALRDAGKKISSFEVLSQIMPPLTMVYKTKLFEDGEEYKDSNNVLEIRNGKYTRGQLEKSVLGSTTKGILHRVFNDYGPKACADFNDNLQNVVTEYMKSSAYSVGVSDLIADKVTQEKIIQVITTQKTEVQALIDKVHLGAFENSTANTNIAEFETSVNNILNKATEQSGKIGRTSLDPNNRFLMIVNSGSKGSLINISQMISCLGQQNVDGKRIPYGFDSRTLPHYNKFDDSPNARGFIENSYISGLTAPELFFHAMGGRIGLIDTAVKTSQTGYIQRRLIKGLEDLKVEYDMTVRNNMGKIIQFAYGDDCFDSTKVENQSIPLVGMSVEDIYMHFDIIGINDQTSELLSVYAKSTASRIKKQKEDTKNKCQAYIDKMLAARDDIVKGVFNNKNDNNVVLPIALQNIIANIQGQLGLNSNSTVDITPLEAFELIEDNFKKMNQLAYAPLTRLFEIVYYYYLSPKELLVNKRFHRKGLTLLLDTICLKHKEALIHPGEMVGVIAGQSIGEPTTQLTLNSVTYETEILVRNANKEIKSVQIGDFTKWGIETSTKIDYMEDKDTTYAELSEYYEVPGVTEDGETVWRRIEAVTRHPVINEDGTNTMLKVTTKGNREVTTTKAKGFLQLIDGKIVGVDGGSLKIGDYLPVSKKTIAYSNAYDKRNCELLSHVNYKDCEIASYLSDEDVLVPNVVNGETIMQPRNGLYPDIEFDQIVSIEYVQNTTSYAYDLTVQDTRNFDCRNGICQKDTFHLSGVASKSNVTRGVPRIEEILRLTKNPKNPSLTVYLKTMDQNDKDKASNYATMMSHTRLVDVVKSIQICFDPNEQSTLITEDRQLMEQYYEFERIMNECNGTSSTPDDIPQRSKWVIRMEMDAETLLDKNITMDDIHFAVSNSHFAGDLSCVYSDYNSDKLVFRIRMSNNIFTKGKKRGVADTLDQSDEIYLLKNFQDSLLNNIVLRGINGIDNVLARKVQNMVVKEDGKYVTKDTWVLDTTGSNLLEALALDFIDPSRTLSNDIREVFDVLGIEAARQMIFNELSEVMEFSGVYINYHHLSLLCDRMTCNQNMVPIFRSGLLSDNVGPIAKATFEVHTEVLLDAARHGEIDHMRGVSANVMCGQFGNYGTGSFQLVLDMKEFEKLDAEVSKTVDANKEIEDAFGSVVDNSTDVCSKNKIEIKNNIANIHVPGDAGVCDDGYDAGF